MRKSLILPAVLLVAAAAVAGAQSDGKPAQKPAAQPAKPAAQPAQPLPPAPARPASRNPCRTGPAT